MEQGVPAPCPYLEVLVAPEFQTLPFIIRWSLWSQNPGQLLGGLMADFGTHQVTDHALITWLSCTDHMTAHALITWMIIH